MGMNLAKDPEPNEESSDQNPDSGGGGIWISDHSAALKILR